MYPALTADMGTSVVCSRARRPREVQVDLIAAGRCRGDRRRVIRKWVLLTGLTLGARAFCVDIFGVVVVGEAGMAEAADGVEDAIEVEINLFFKDGITRSKAGLA